MYIPIPIHVQFSSINSFEIYPKNAETMVHREYHLVLYFLLSWRWYRTSIFSRLSRNASDFAVKICKYFLDFKWYITYLIWLFMSKQNKVATKFLHWKFCLFCPYNFDKKNWIWISINSISQNSSAIENLEL